MVGAGQNLAIDLHYADSWADPHNQPKPYAWSNLPFDQFVDDVYKYTYDFAKSLVDQGTTPSIVAIGNEIINGMLWGSEYDTLTPYLDYHHYYTSGRHLAAPGGGVEWLKYEEAKGDTSSPAYQEFLASLENPGSPGRRGQPRRPGGQRRAGHQDRHPAALRAQPGGAAAAASRGRHRPGQEVRRR